jgi:hypothetical protein
MYEQRKFAMLKVARSKYIAVALIISFIIFCSPHLSLAQAVTQGSLSGFIYAEDGVTPLEGAVVKIRNIVDGTIYESTKSDSEGAFKIEGIKEGLYSAGISTAVGDFNFENLIGVKAGETAKVSLALVPSGDQTVAFPEEQAPPIQAGSEVIAPTEAVFLGKVVNYNPETQEVSIYIEEGMMQLGDKLIFRGTETDFTQNVKSIRVELVNVEKAIAGQTPDVKVGESAEVGDFVYLRLKRRAFFFFTPIGMATVLAATAGVVYGVVKLTEEEEEVSAFKK